MNLRAYRCERCAAEWRADARRWRCDCGGLLGLAPTGSSPAPVAVGAGSTPEEVVHVGGRRVRAKLEHVAPTGSFKDRGAEVLVGLAVAVGASRLVVDSTGNAGAAIAAHGAAAGLPVEVFVSASASPGKVAAVERQGASLVRIDGTREDVAAAAIVRVGETGAFYASHVYNPWFFEGVSRLVDELDPLPDTVLVPVGNGTLVLGVLSALDRLDAIGRCRIVGVQAAACAPVARAFAAGLDRVDPVAGGSTIADGITIGAPPRGAEVLAAVRATGGRVVAVQDSAIEQALAELADQGHRLDPTAAVAPAGARWLTDDDGDVVVPLTGVARGEAPPS